MSWYNKEDFDNIIDDDVLNTKFIDYNNYSNYIIDDYDNYFIDRNDYYSCILKDVKTSIPIMIILNKSFPFDKIDKLDRIYFNKILEISDLPIDEYRKKLTKINSEYNKYYNILLKYV